MVIPAASDSQSPPVRPSFRVSGGWPSGSYLSDMATAPDAARKIVWNWGGALFVTALSWSRLGGANGFYCSYNNYEQNHSNKETLCVYK